MDAVRSFLQPVTRSLPAPLLKLGLDLLGADCYKSIILDLNLEDAACTKLALSKGLGVGIVAASGVVKIPQILKLLQSQSAAGVSFLAYLLETAAFVITLAYSARSGYPFSTYGETALIAAQNIAICLLVLKYKGQTAAAALFGATLLAGGYALQTGSIVDMKMLGYAQAGAGLLGVASKLPQILTIWKEGGTGQLSAFAVFNYLAGSLSRIFTTLQEVDDPLILYGFVAGFFLNAVMAMQMIYYWRSPASSSHAKEFGKRPEKIAMGSSSSADIGRAKGPSTRRRG